MNRSWIRVASLAVAAALIVPSLTGQAKLTVAELTAAKSIGSRQAPITLEVFSDYQCPDCKRLHSATTQQVIDNYVSSGKVYLVHRDFPLSMHPYSRQAARWLNAAAAAGLFVPKAAPLVFEGPTDPKALSFTQPLLPTILPHSYRYKRPWDTI